jgi:hypothetical protein
MTIQEGEHVLRVADMWQMDELKDSVVLYLGPLFTDETAALKLHMSDAYYIDHWAHSAIKCLVLRSNSLSSHDIETLGPVLSAAIMQVRETDISGTQAGAPRSVTHILTDHEILRIFGCRSP